MTPQHEQRRPDHVRTAARIPPGQAVDPPLDRAAQQPVPRRIELDLVDPVAVAVVGAEDRDVALGAPAVLERLDAPGHGARLPCAVGPPVAALTLQPFLQREIDFEEVDRLERWRLVQDLASGIDGVKSRHDVNPDSQGYRRPTRRGALDAWLGPSWGSTYTYRQCCGALVALQGRID